MADQSPPATPLKAHLSQFESIDKHVDHANRVALDNEIAGSTGRRNTGVKSLCWGFKLQGLTWSFV